MNKKISNIKTSVNSLELEEYLSLWNIIGKATNLLKYIALQYINDRMEGRKIHAPTIVLRGNPGSGRATLARSFSNAIGGDFKEAVGKTLGMGECLYNYFEDSGPDTVFYIRGAEELGNYSQTIICRLLREQILHVPIRSEQKMKKVYFPAKPLIIFSINFDSWLNCELRNIIDIEIELDKYSEDELFQILKQRCDCYCKWAYKSDELLKIIAQNADGNPGKSMRLLQISYSIMRAGDKNIMKMKDVKKAVELLIKKGLKNCLDNKNS